MWANLENQPDTKAMDSFYAVGFEQSPNDSYFNNINNLIALKPSGSRIYKSGPRQGLYLLEMQTSEMPILVLIGMIIT